jgi:hypothetical protein
MVDVVELRNADNTLQQWAKEIRHESVPAPYATADETLECWNGSPIYLTKPRMRYCTLERRRQNNEAATRGGNAACVISIRDQASARASGMPTR